MSSLETKTIQASGEAAEKAASKFDKFVASLKRIAMYRLVRTIIRELSQAFREGIENMYYWAQVMGHDYYNSMNLASSASMELKNSLAVAIMPIVVELIPLFKTLADWVAVACNTLARFFAIMKGTPTYVAVNTNYVEKFGEKLDKAAGSAKEFRKQLMAFDEINLIQMPHNGSSGSGANLPDYSDMFEELKTESLGGYIDNLAITLDNVLFKWGPGLNAEILAEKAIAAFGAVVGGLIGGMLTGGSLFGIVLGATAGLALGILLDAAIFDNDGTLSDLEAKITAMVLTALGAIAGAAVGHIFGAGLLISGIVGATIGVAVGYALYESGKSPSALYGSTDKGANGWEYKSEMTGHDFLGIPLKDIQKIFTEDIPGWCNDLTTNVDTSLTDFADSVQGAYDDFIGWVHDMDDGIEGFVGDVTKFFDDIDDDVSLFRDNIATGLAKVRLAAEDWWRSLKLWWEGLSLPEFKIKLPTITWEKKQAEGWAADVLTALGLPTELPKMNVTWNARGGVISAPTLIGAGEAGAEAIVPLENNTEWIDKVADRLAAAGRQGGDTRVYLNGREIAKAVYSDHNSQVLQTGQSPLMI